MGTDIKQVDPIEAEKDEHINILKKKSKYLEVKVPQMEEENQTYKNEIARLKEELKSVMKYEDQIEDSPDDFDEDQRNAKRQFLQDEIIDAGLSPDDFILYCREEKSSDIDEWEYDELVECVKGFKSFTSSSTREKGSEDSSSNSSDSD